MIPMRTPFCVLVALLCACRPTPAPEPTTTAVVDPTGVTTEPAPSSDDGGTATPGVPDASASYDLVVSFTSPGDGTDSAAADRLAAIVTDTPGLAYVRGHWGREGEHDDCFGLSGLSAEARKAFVDRVRAEVGNSPKVTITESAECKNSR